MDDKFIEAGSVALRNNRSASSLLVDFVYRHKRGIQQDPRVMDFLHDAFCQILCNVPADKALHLKDSKPGPKSNNWERDLRIYEAVIKLKIKGKKTTEAFKIVEVEGVYVFDPIEGIGEVKFCGPSTIRDAYYKYQKVIPYNK